MANFQTAEDLRLDALWLAGEPTDASSSYFDKALDYVNAVLKSLVVGGSLGPEWVQPVDWWWARQFPRGVLHLLPTVDIGTISLVQNSASVSFGTMPAGRSIRNSYIIVDLDPRWSSTLTTHNAPLSGSFNVAWPYATVTTPNVTVAPVFVELPGDFLRFVTPVLSISADRYIELVDSRTLDDMYPLPRVREGDPVMAALVTYATTTPASQHNYLLRLSHYPRQTVDVEFDYIPVPTIISAGAKPRIPESHRRILSFGAAFLLLLDKSDGNAEVRYRQFVSAWETMADEHGKQTHRGGESHGRIFPRGRHIRRRLLRTESGLIIG